MLTLTEEQTTRLLELLGLPADTDLTDVDAILAVIESLTEVEASGDDTKPSAVAAAAKRLGLEAIDTDTLAALRADATEGRQIKAAAAKAKVEGQVDDAIRHGKIPPSRRTHWVDLITADAGMADVLASTPNETAVPMTEIGHGQTSDGEHLDEPAPWFH